MTEPEQAAVPDREARRARREAEWARRDAEAEQRARLDARIDDAAAAAPSVLPGEVGETLAAVLAAMKPFRAADGYLAFSAVGRSSDEVVALAEAILAVPDTGQARADHLAAGIRRFADDCKLLLDFGGLDNRVARSIAQQERNLRGLLAEPSADTVQTPDAPDLAYARSEVDKWLASTDPYCILPTRTEHIPALLARLDELEGTR